MTNIDKDRSNLVLTAASCAKPSSPPGAGGDMPRRFIDVDWNKQHLSNLDPGDQRLRALALPEFGSTRRWLLFLFVVFFLGFFLSLLYQGMVFV